MTLSPPQAAPPVLDLESIPAVREPAAGQAWTGIPPFTCVVWRMFAVLAVLFVAAVEMRLNGSSSGFIHASNFADIRVRDVPSGILLGKPKFIRGDEWYVWTPATLSQARQPVSFPVSNPSLGPGKTPLLMSLPVRYYTMIFRPQLWGYFFLPFDHAFAWNWNVKVFGLYAGLFTLFWTLTAGRMGWSVFGALAVEFSSYVQWWFSTPAMMPEMLACWALGIVAVLALFQRRTTRRGQLLAAAGLVACLTNFLLCCYPGFEIPLVYLGACMMGGYIWQHRIFSWRGAAWVAGAGAVSLALLVPWLLDCLPLLRLEAETIYPGQRRVYGGGLPLGGYLSGLFALYLDDQDFPLALGNVCEASNFYPLWLLPLGMGVWACGRRVVRGEGPLGSWLRERGVKVGLTACLAALTIFCLVPLPPWLCELTLLRRCLEVRLLLPVGLAGTLLLVLCMASQPAAMPWRPTRRTLVAGLAWVAGVAAFLLWDRISSADFLTPGKCAAVLATAAFAGGAYLCGPRWLLPPVWVGACFLKFALVNPLCAGLPELLDSPMMNRLHALVQADPSAQWAVFDSVPGAELIKTTGAHVINGAHIIPDFPTIDRLDPTHRYRDVYNRYGHLCFQESEYQRDVTAELNRMVHCEVRLHPRRLRELFPEVKYMVSTGPMVTAKAGGFALIGDIPDHHFWLYRVADPPKPVGTR